MNKEERKKYMKEYREKNKEKIKEKRKEWEKTHNRNEYKRIWREKNKEHCKEYQKYRSVAHIKQLEEENKQLKERIQDALGISNERINYYFHINNEEVLRDWEEIFDVLKGDSNEDN